MWWARYEHTTPVTILCPVCAGKREVVLILGSGEACVLRCDYCRRGYSGPRGYVEEYQSVAKAERVHIQTVTVTQTKDGEKREYRVRDHYIPNAADLFATEAEALARAKERAEADRVARETRAEHVKKQQAKSYSWNAGYHMRVAKTARQDVEYHERMARICKAKAKDGAS